MLTKLVNGKRVELTAEEEAVVLAEWQYNIDNPEPPPGPTVEERIKKLEEEVEVLKGN